MMNMMTTMVKDKAKVEEGSDTLENPIPFCSDTGVYREDYHFKHHKRLKSIEGVDTFGSVEAEGLCLVLDVFVPPKFKVPDFEKFNGSSCRITHIAIYCKKMFAYSKDEKLLMHIFQDSLTRLTAHWYVQLDRSWIQTWGELARAFITQYKHIVDMALDCLTLQNIEKKSNESFKEYAQWWRDLASQVQSPLTEKETTVPFVGMLKGIYYDRMVGNTSKNFTDMVLSEEMIENALKSGKIYYPLSAKRVIAGKKKEPNTSTPLIPAVNAINASPFMYHSHVPITNPPMLTMPTRSPQTQAPLRPPRERPVFDPILISYAKIFPILVEKHLLVPIHKEPMQ
ncbi:hypothetical protein V6Z11_D02G139700 [Gossypium hirsutum]